MSATPPSLKLLPKLLAILTVLLGCFVMTGWFLKNASIVQINPSFAPMQFNTALLFVMTAGGLWALFENELKVSRLLGALISLFSLLTISQYLTGADLGIDQLFVDHFVDVNTASPGRMAPNTGLCFFVLGIQLAFVNRTKTDKKNQWSFFAGGLVLAMSMVALFGYFNNVTTTYGWGQLTHMALHTSVGFVLLSLAIIIFWIQRFGFQSRLLNIPVLVGIFTITSTLMLWQALHGQETLEVERRITFYADSVESDINQQFSDYSDGLLKVNALLQERMSNPELNTDSLLESFFISFEAVQAIYVKNTTTSGYRSFQFDPLTPVYFSNEDLFNLGYSNIFLLENKLPTFVARLSSSSSDSILLYLKRGKSGAPDVVLVLEAKPFFEKAISRYTNFGLKISLESNNGSALLEESEAQNAVHTISREINKTGWTLKVALSSDALGLGSLANVVLAFGLIFSMLLVLVSQLFLNSKRRTAELTKEMEARQKVSAEINEKNAILEIASKVADLGIWSWDLLSNTVSWNDNMYRIYDSNPNELPEDDIFRFWQQTIHPDDKEQTEQSLFEAVSNKTDWVREFRLKLGNKKIKYISAKAALILDEQNNPVKMIGGNYDLTELRNAQERLVELKEKADRNSFAKSQFLANMSHEIRTPMNGVLGITDLLKNTELDSLQQEYLELIKNSAGSLLRILNDILDHSKIEAGMLELIEENFSLDNKVGDILKGFAPTAHQKMIELEYNIDQNVPDCIYADGMRVGQIIFNLVGNAVKFTDSGEINIEVRAIKDKNELQIGEAFSISFSIKDTGIGIPKDKMDAIFEPFGQIDGSTTRRFGGTGLGLPIVKQLTNLMGGNLQIFSQESIGTTITITVPVKKGDISKLDNEAYHAHIIQEFDFTGMTCMAVDDNSVNRKWLKNMITSWGCKAIIAGSSDQALALYQNEVAKQEKIDVLIVDREMPGGDGFQFLEQLKEKYKNIPRVIMMLTSNEISQDLEQIKSMGIDNYLLKPVKQSEVFNMLTTVMEFDRPDLHHTGSEKLPSPNKLLNILVAEDNPINSRLVHDILTYRGHHSTLVFNGKQALEQYKGGDYDLILMDVQMPELDGLEATKLIRRFEEHKSKPAVKIIGLTAHALSGDRQICIEAGMDNYLTKPIDSKKLLLTIESYFKDNDGEEVQEKNNSRVKKEESKQSTKAQAAPYSHDNIEKSNYKLLNLAGLHSVTGGQSSTILAMIEMTLKLLPEEKREIVDFIANENWSELGKLLHRMKGMLSNLTGSSLEQDFKSLEHLTTQKNKIKLLEEWKHLESKLNVLIRELRFYQEHH